MGIWRDAFAAPTVPTLPPVESFGRLLVDFGHEQLVEMPWTMIAGRIDVNTTLLWSGGVISQAADSAHAPGTVLTCEPDEMPGHDDPAPWGRSREQVRVVASGDTVLDIVPALARARYGQEDIAVVFRCLNFDNPALLRHYWHADPRTVLVCYALAQPQPRLLNANLLADRPDGDTHDVRVCVVNTFKFGDDGVCPAIQDVLRRHLGPDLVRGQIIH